MVSFVYVFCVCVCVLFLYNYANIEGSTAFTKNAPQSLVSLVLHLLPHFPLSVFAVLYRLVIMRLLVCLV